MRKKNLKIEKMIDLENKIHYFKKDYKDYASSDTQLAKKLKLKVEYLSPNQLGPKTEASLSPCNLEDYLGIIKVDTKYKGTRFALIHEIIHYILDVGIGNQVKEEFTRNTKGNTKSEHEQEINYAAAALILDYDEIKSVINKYDTTKPKMDELKLVHDLCVKYSQERTTVIRRIQEVRTLMKHNYVVEA